MSNVLSHKKFRDVGDIFYSSYIKRKSQRKIYKKKIKTKMCNFPSYHDKLVLENYVFENFYSNRMYLS